MQYPNFEEEKPRLDAYVRQTAEQHGPGFNIDSELGELWLEVTNNAVVGAGRLAILEQEQEQTEELTAWDEVQKEDAKAALKNFSDNWQLMVLMHSYVDEALEDYTKPAFGDVVSEGCLYFLKQLENKSSVFYRLDEAAREELQCLVFRVGGLLMGEADLHFVDLKTA